MPEPNVRRASQVQGFDNPATQATFNRDEAVRVNADVDKDLAHDQTEREKMLAEITERLNNEIMDMVLYNDTFMAFIGSYLQAAFDFGDRNGLNFWNVGIDGSKSWYAHDGKTIMVDFCYTERNKNPINGEVKTPGGIILPGGK